MANFNLSYIRLPLPLTVLVASEAPKLALENVETQLNMAQLNGILKEHTSPDRQRNGSLRAGSSPITRGGLQLPIP